MIKLPPEIAEQLPTLMKMPEGSVSFTVTFKTNFFVKHAKGELLFGEVAGLHYFRLERTESSQVKFYRSAPSVGTQMSVVDISDAPAALKVMFTFTWSPVEANLYVGPMEVEGGELITGESMVSDRNFVVDKMGDVNEVGSPGVNVLSVRVVKGKEVVLTSSAYEYWQEAKVAISSLLDEQEGEDFFSKLVKANAAFIFVVTGFESYCKKRVYELDNEGVSLLWDKFEEETKITKGKLLADTASYFQSTENVKGIWKLLTGISIAETDAPSWQVLVRAFKFRHKIAHVSPILSIVNEGVSNESPLFSSLEIQNAVTACDVVIEKLHTETLKLR